MAVHFSGLNGLDSRSAVDSQNLSDDVKLHYLKSLVKDKAETAIAEFAYSGTMYKDALMKLERKFGQPQIIIRAYLDKLYNSPPVKTIVPTAS